jgi:Kelch motif
MLTTGLLTSFLAISPLEAATPPDLTIHRTTINVGPVTSGAGARSSGHIFFAGGHPNGTSGVTNVVTRIDLLTKAVTTVAPLPTARAGLGLIEQESFAGDHLYAIGGVNASGQALNTVEVYDFTANSWSEAAPMPTARGYLAVVAAEDGKIYAIGGTDDNGPLATVEAYDPSNNTWSPILPLNTPRSHLAATLGPEEIIYAAGGIGVGGVFLNSVEVHGVAGGVGWATSLPMNTARSDFGLALGADNFIHAFGGKNSSGALKSIEGLNTTTFVWTVEPESLPHPQTGLAAVEGLTGSDYLLGGNHGSTLITHVIKGVPPAAPSHTVVWFFHQGDEPLINGNSPMDQEPPLGVGSLQLSILSGTSFSSFPAVTGTIQAGGTVVLSFPVTLGLGLLTTFTLSATDTDGGSPQVLGSVTELIAIGFGGTVQIPVSTPLVLKNKVLVLTISDLLGLDLNLDFSRFFVTITGVNGTP